MLDHNQQKLQQIKNWINQGETFVRIIKLTGSAKSYLFSQLLNEFNRPCLAILPDKQSAEKFYKELQFFWGKIDGTKDTGSRLFLLPPYDISPLTGLSPGKNIIHNRLQALYALISYKNPIIITSLDSILFNFLPKKAFVKALEYLEVSEDVERNPLLETLEINGYQHVSMVEEMGDYSVRGGVIDLFSPLYSKPVRLEFWGDRLEAIRLFDPLSQRSEKHLSELIILPAAEIIMGKNNIRQARSMGRLPNQLTGNNFAGQEAWLNHFYPHPDSIFQYLPENILVTLFNPYNFLNVYKKQLKKFNKGKEKYHKEASEKGVPFPETDDLIFPFQEISQQLKTCQRLEFSELDLLKEEQDHKIVRIETQSQEDDIFDVHLTGKGRVSIAPLAEKISYWLNLHARVIIVCRVEQQANRLMEILEGYEIVVNKVIPGWASLPSAAGLYICLGHLSKGFAWKTPGLFIISEDEIFGPKYARSRPRKKASDQALVWSSFSQLQKGDFVVHEEHGIGRYQGLLKMEIVNKVNDFVVIEYLDNAKLYVPADRISIMQKYAGADDRNPVLDQLGGHSWNLTKQKTKQSVKKIAKQLVNIYALRKYRKGFSFSPPDQYYHEFEATFEHEETSDQKKAIEDVLTDMTSDQPMDRLICGDVGFGKTEIAIRAAFKAVIDGKQVAFLVPTTVLAEQHYETFKKRMTEYPIKIGILSRFRTRAEQVKILRQLNAGEIHIIIGTHRILQKDVKFADLGLLIIDEEQRFGVKQKETLKKYRSLVDVLAITATPVPRTLHMSMMGVRDLSVIETPPEDRQAIQTHLSLYDEALITSAICLEHDRGGQVFFVHNKVHNIHLIADKLKQMVPKSRVGIAHGQMKEKELEQAMLAFTKKQIDVLVCTTIIESGLDIPSANTIIINDVDKLGLAQIYQLRGRVGRASDNAYAYLLFSSSDAITKNAEKRLKALMDFTNLGAGMRLAMHDLKIRGGGNILGFSQSGHIAAVGYELYLKFIERAIAELKGEDWHDDINPEIHVDISAFLPSDYVMDTDVRLNLYRRLSILLEKSELEAMIDEIRDRFGPPPIEVQNLLNLMSMRIILKTLGISRLDIKENSISLSLFEGNKLDSKKLIQFVKKKPNRYRFLSQNMLNIYMGVIKLPEDFIRVEKTILELVS